MQKHELSVHTFQKTLGRHREICILTKLPQNCFKGIETLRTVCYNIIKVRAYEECCYPKIRK